MSKFKITPQAREDFKEIGRFTEKRWGRTQRIKYLEKLRSRIRDLAKGIVKGRMRHDIPNSPMGFHEGRHVIFYRYTDYGIEMLRVLHDSRDFRRHFT